MSHDPQYLTNTLARAWLAEALRRLAAARTQVDRLNVFPVPDADTGTNVVLTVSAAVRSAQNLPADATLGQLSAAVARGALWGARGNSGIIISQVLQAFAQVCAEHDALGATELIQVCDAAAIAAREAIPQPVDGTIITVCQDVADAVMRLPLEATAVDVARCAATAAHTSLARTGELLAANTGAHAAFDAGAACYVIVLDALASVFDVGDVPEIAWPSEHDACQCATQVRGGGEFEVMYVYQATRREAIAMRQRLTDVGDSVAVVEGGDQHWHVHVHLDKPAEALPQHGETKQVIVRHLQPEATGYGVVATTKAPGLLEDLARCGAITTLAPTHSALVRAIIDTGATEVTVLPASTRLAQLAAGAKNDPLVLAEGIDVRIAPTDCDAHVYAACAQWALTQLLEADPHPYPIAAEIAASMRIVDLQPAPGRDASVLPASTLGDITGSEEPVTLFIGARASAPDLARRLQTDLQARGVEVHVVAAGQMHPAVQLAYVSQGK